MFKKTLLFTILIIFLPLLFGILFGILFGNYFSGSGFFSAYALFGWIFIMVYLFFQFFLGFLSTIFNYGKGFKFITFTILNFIAILFFLNASEFYDFYLILQNIIIIIIIIALSALLFYCGRLLSKFLLRIFQK
ncbi:MAG: hypothetical protein WCV92_02445 [Candidatus Buchananbacteria bacterium]